MSGAGLRWTLVVLTALLVVLGLAAQWSVGAAMGVPFERDTLRWLVVAAVAACLVRVVPPRWVLRNASVLYLGALILLLAVPFVGEVRHNARRWIVVAGFSIQPSELMKFAFVILWARLLRHDRARKGWRALTLPAIAFVVPAAAVFMQPDLGTALLFVPTAFAMLFAAGIDRRKIATILVGGVVVASLGYGTLRPYQKERILSTIQRERLTAAERAREGYQLEQSLRSIAAGGLAGEGLGDGILNRLNVLPFRHNDFIFAVIAEELGFLGAGAVIAVAACIVIVLMRMGLSIRDESGRLLCVGMAAIYGSQTFVHIGVNLGAVPTTGMPLPFVSAGGTALLTFAAALSLAASVARNPDRVIGGDSLAEQLARLEKLLPRRRRARAAAGVVNLQGSTPVVDSAGRFRNETV